ncbi:hypothetical protein JOF53_007663 [Crossiella equi]|uniref:Uncharacterized protein n=1 Tax=Crossiella equi TaxID=130796 RepID=A0ABS5AQT3_9PSEU|nr:hypothetical protein [Crossiella equi]MBP2478791.1 hypothetical protein [Crossiella equi]
MKTSWTKASRGGAAATRRNALPVAFTLPETTVPLWHEVRMTEWDNGFTPRHTVRPGAPPRHEVHVREEEGRLRVMPPWRQYVGDTPRRPPAVRLGPGEWLRWQTTYRRARLSGGGEWVYSLETLNLAYGPVPADCFLGTPTRSVDERAQLTTYRRLTT